MKKFESPLAAFLYWEQKTPHKLFLKQPRNGQIKEYSYLESGDEMRRLAAGLKSFNFPPQSKIALLSKNCAHWVMADLAIMFSGYISVPIYPTLNADSIHQILTHSEAKAIIIGKLDDFNSQKSGIPEIVKISTTAYEVNEGLIWEDLIQQHQPIQEIPKKAKDDLITIIYTSGTTGTPKGVMHVPASFAKITNMIIERVELPNHPRFFSYLPLSHIAERLGIEMQSLFRGGSLTFPESLATFATELEATQPHLFFSVPRVWAKFQEKVLEKMPQNKLTRLLKLPVIGTLVKKKIVRKLGLAEAQYIVSGAAPIDSGLLDWFEKLGVIICQAYGMTEDGLYSHYNFPDANKKGTVGKKFPDAKVKLSPDSEICIKSDGLMKGYYKAPELTAEVFDDDGYFKTGDLGEFDHDGYLTITGRLKDQFKTDKGKYISPAPIELELLKSSFIEQICIVGTGIPQPIALITLSAIGKAQSSQEISKHLIHSINTVNHHLEKHEKIEKALIMSEEWTVDNGLTTPTMKIKRNSIEKIHRDKYKSWFKQDEKVIFE